MFSAKADSNKRGDGFNIGDRDNILDTVEAGPILVHVALAEGRQFPYEAIMRSVFKHLMDSATSEYLFTMEFFKVCLRVLRMISRPSPRVLYFGKEVLSHACCRKTGFRYFGDPARDAGFVKYDSHVHPRVFFSRKGRP